jgi:hypothetical protein
MQMAGCPLDFRQLRLPTQPLTVANGGLSQNIFGGSNVMLREGKAWLALYLSIRIFGEVNIGSLRVRAHWLGGEASLVSRCPDHNDYYCLPVEPGGAHLTAASNKTLNLWVEERRQLGRGTRLSGFLLAEGQDCLTWEAGEYLEAQLCFDDWTGKKMVFPIVVVNRLMRGWD